MVIKLVFKTVYTVFVLTATGYLFPSRTFALPVVPTTFSDTVQCDHESNPRCLQRSQVKPSFLVSNLLAAVNRSASTGGMIRCPSGFVYDRKGNCRPLLCRGLGKSCQDGAYNPYRRLKLLFGTDKYTCRSGQVIIKCDS